MTDGDRSSIIKDKKLEAYEFGKYAEDLISRQYIEKGYAILERRWKCGKSEIDIIAGKDDVIVIIEVKARSGDAEEAFRTVTKDKKRRMVRAADSYIGRLKGEYQYRFDIACCTGHPGDVKIDIFEDAFVAAEIF